jgi:hypothetical protein
MDRELQRILVELARSHGFEVTVQYLAPNEMTRLIPDFHSFPPNQILDVPHRMALLQNLCRVILKTCCSHHPASIQTQSRLYRFRFLRQAMPEAADAYAAVLGYLGIEVPNYLLKDE